MTSWKHSPLTIGCAAALLLLALVLHAVGLTGALFGPAPGGWLPLLAWAVTPPSVALFVWAGQPATPRHRLVIQQVRTTIGEDRLVA